MILYIVRHAWAGQFGDPTWPDDFDRPLSDRGAKRFSRVVEELIARDFAPRIVVTSPLVRCRQTAEIISRFVPGRPEVVPRPELAPTSDIAGLIRWFAEEVGDPLEAAWVGHAPDVGYLAAALIGNGEAQIGFSKGAVAAIEFEGVLASGAGELRWLVTAKLLGC